MKIGNIMYQYRAMTTEERWQVREARKARGYPVHAPPHFLDEGQYLVTAACFNHEAFINSPALLSLVSNGVLSVLATISNINAWIFMPTHYHVSLDLRKPNELSEVVRKVHSKLSTEINKLQMAKGRRIWYRYSDRRIRSSEHYWTAINYIHANAVKHGFTTDLQLWQWSSYSIYSDIYDEEWITYLHERYRPGQLFGRGWDD